MDILDEFSPDDIFIIPVRTEECEPLDEKLASLHWADLFPSYEFGIDSILKVLKPHEDQIIESINTVKDMSKSVIESVESVISNEGQPEKVIKNSIGMTFVYIPPGTFMMGSPPYEKYRNDNETQHKVTISKGFYMQSTQVTQGQWKAVMGNNPSYFKNGDNYPVETVSWNDTQEFIKKLNSKDNKGYRLPTEAEWEYACRAGTITPFYFGETISTDQVNYNGNYPYGNGKKGIYREKTTPVGTFPPNDWGLFDMHGNVWEWCNDWYGDYSDKPVTDLIGATTGSSRVLRGGSWYYYARYCRSALRDYNSPSYRGSRGFRLACSFPALRTLESQGE